MKSEKEHENSDEFEDDDSLAIEVNVDASKGLVVIEFGTPIAWFTLPPNDLRRFIRLLQTSLNEMTGH